MSTDLHQGIFDAALQISARRARVLREIKSLLEDDRDREALKLMRDYLQVVKKAKTPRPDRRYPRSLALVRRVKS